MDNYIAKKDVAKYLEIDEKEFENYFKFSKEIVGEKLSGRWYFNKNKLSSWKKSKAERTVLLGTVEYEQCFEFAIKMVYGGLSLHGIRGQRSEVQAADDVILGILAEHAVKKFLLKKYEFNILLDEEVHTNDITPQDIHKIIVNGQELEPKIGVGIKASKFKNAYLILGSKEVDLVSRASDVYIFARVGLPPDHLFRRLRDHSFFKKAKEFLENRNSPKLLEELGDIPVWICGFVYKSELEKVTEIPNQTFDSGYRYVKSVAGLHNTDAEWVDLLKKL